MISKNYLIILIIFNFYKIWMTFSNNFIVFHIHYKTNFGENLFVTGNIPELGNWDLHKSLKL